MFWFRIMIIEVVLIGLSIWLLKWQDMPAIYTLSYGLRFFGIIILFEASNLRNSINNWRLRDKYNRPKKLDKSLPEI